MTYNEGLKKSEPTEDEKAKQVIDEIHTRNTERADKDREEANEKMNREAWRQAEDAAKIAKQQKQLEEEYRHETDRHRAIRSEMRDLDLIRKTPSIQRARHEDGTKVTDAELDEKLFRLKNEYVTTPMNYGTVGLAVTELRYEGILTMVFRDGKYEVVSIAEGENWKLIKDANGVPIRATKIIPSRYSSAGQIIAYDLQLTNKYQRKSEPSGK